MMFHSQKVRSLEVCHETSQANASEDDNVLLTSKVNLADSNFELTPMA